MNINEIEVNGEKFGLESVNDTYVGRKEPEGEIKPTMWYKPADYYIVYSKFGMQKKPGSSNTRGDYSLDNNGQLVETTDTTSTALRTTNEFSLLRNEGYKLIMRSSISSSTNQYTFGMYFYDKDGNFVDKSTFTTQLDTAYPAGTPLLEVTFPEEARYARILMPYTYTGSTYLYLLYADTSDDIVADIISGTTSTSAAGWYYYDEDVYVKL